MSARPLPVLAVAVAVVLVGSALSTSASSTRGQTTTATPASRLFVESASSGNLSTGAGGTMTLRLVGVPTTLWFTDRPARKTGVIETAAFVQNWSATGDFASQPPNGVLEGRVKGVRRVLPVELTTARYEPDTRTVEYTVKAVSHLPGLYKTKGESPQLGAGEFGSSSLFIDDANSQTGCWVQWTIPNIVFVGGGDTEAGLQIASGGTFSYSYGPEVQAIGGGVLYSFVGPGGTIGNNGPEQWGTTPSQLDFGGDGLGGGTLQFLAWFEPTPGAPSLTGTVVGAGALPTANAPSIFAGACPNVTVANTPPAYSFTITFRSNA